MHRTRAYCGLIVFILFISLVLPSAAVADSKSIKLRAVVVGNDGRGTIHIQDLKSHQRWVLVFRDGKFYDDGRARYLSVGDVVEVKAERLGSGHLLARKVTVLGRTAAVAPGSVGDTPPVVIVQPQPQPPVVIVRPQPQPPVQAQPAGIGGSNTIGAIVKTLGIGAAVKIFAVPLNNFINRLLLNRGAAVQAQTKVVPILSVSVGLRTPGSAHVGAAQVSGPATVIGRVQAVALLEVDYQQDARVKAFVPVDNLQPWQAFKRVPGVGVSAIIELRI
jgi:hypothetical protein